MKHNRQTLWMGRILALLLVAGLVLLVIYWPLVAAILFVAMAISLAVVNGKVDGFSSGMRLFLKEMFLGWGRHGAMNDTIKMRDGDTMLIMVKDGAVIHFTPNMSLPHSEFVRRTTRQLPEGAWVGTVSKLDGEIAAITSKYFFGYQLPAPPEVLEVVRRTFE